MIVKNEEDWIENAVSSVIPLVSEVIILDTGSTDYTLERVKRFEPRIFNAEWGDHFGDARNMTLEEARYPWILVLDADECISSSDLRQLREATGGSYAGYHLTQRNYVYQNHVYGWRANTADYAEGKAYPGYVDNPLIRFFRNDSRLRFEGAVHEIIDPTRLEPSLRFSSLPVVIHHYGKVRGSERVAAKQHFYLRLGRRKLDEDPTNAKAYLDYGIQLQELGRHADSIEPFRKFLEMSGDPIGLLYSAIAEKTLGRYAEAGELLDEAARKGLDTFELHLERGNVWLALGEYDRALARYRTCLERRVDNPVATFNVGLAYKNMGRLDKAVAYYRRARNLDPGFVQPAMELASIHTDAGEYGTAAEILEQLLSGQPERREVRLALVKAYLQLHRPDDALTTLGERFGADAVAESLRGAAYLEKGDHDAARAHLESAIHADASLVDARINISHIYARAGEFSRAARHLRQGYDRTRNARLLPALALYEARAGLFDDALVRLDEVIRSGQGSSDHWIYRGLILEQKKMWSELDAHYQAMAEAFPELRAWVESKRAGLVSPAPL